MAAAVAAMATAATAGAATNVNRDDAPARVATGGGVLFSRAPAPRPRAGNSEEAWVIMVNRNLLRQFELSEDDLRQELDAAFDQGGDAWLPPEAQSFRDHRIVTGRVRKVTGDEVWVDVGYKS